MHGLIEVAAVVGRNGHRAVIFARLEQEELDLRMHVAGEARSLALASWRRSTCRESAQDGEPSGMVISQNIRAE